MKKSIFIALVTCALLIFSNIFSSFAQNNNKNWNYILDPHHSNIQWQANHFGFSDQRGSFSNVSGNLFLDEKRPNRSKIEVEINIENIVTGYKSFDNHLKSADFFNVKKFPIAKFKSTKIVMTGKNTAKIYGDLTLIGVTKKIRLNAKLNKIGKNPILKKKTAGFSASAIIKRSEFGMNYAIPSVSDKVKIIIALEANAIEDKN